MSRNLTTLVSAPDHTTVVVKIGGELAASGEVHRIAPDIADLAKSGVHVVVVHGGGPQATALQEALGQVPKIIGGRRVTDAATLTVMKMTVAGQVNVDVCSALVRAGAHPVGLHGASSLAVRAVKRPPRVVSGGGADPVDFGFVGDVVGVNEELLSLLMGAGFVPVIACLGADEAGAVYNINADVVATRVARALRAASLLLVSDVPGVLRDVTDASTRIPKMTAAEGKQAIASGIITKGMIPKIEEGFAAIREGVPSIVILGKLAPSDLGRAVRDPGSVGTVLLPDP